MRSVIKPRSFLLLMLIFIGVTGCNLMENGDNAVLTSPGSVTPSVEQLTNFWVGSGAQQIMIRIVSPGRLMVGAPAGDYLLTYNIKTPVPELPEGFAIIPLYLVFRAPADGVIFTIGLMPGDTIWQVVLQKGEIPADVVPVEQYGDVSIFFREGISTGIGVFSVFAIDFSIEPIELVTEGEIPEELEEAGVVASMFEVTVTVNGPGTVKPMAYSNVPAGASRSFKIHPDSGNFNDISVTVNNKPTDVQKIGKKGDGHLVIHGIDEDLNIVVKFTFTPPASEEK